MIHSRHLLRWLWTLTLLLVSLPGTGKDLAVCIGADGHVELVRTAAHCAADVPPLAGHCEADAADNHAVCLDLLLCAQDDNLLQSRTTSLHPASAPLPAVRLTPPAPEAPRLAPAQPVPHGGWLRHQRTIVLLL